MVRVKKGLAAHKRKKNLLQHTKGFRWGRKSKVRLAREAVLHAWVYSYRDRKNKKRDFRQLWQSQINSACKKNGISYNRFIYKLKGKKIELDRKILSDLAQNNPEIFKNIVKSL